ncbi:MAG: hypothetical protein GX309_09660 [Clostridiales bacterium]|nr:hypothetical protein [Clostridiales bacterium]
MSLANESKDLLFAYISVMIGSKLSDIQSKESIVFFKVRQNNLFCSKDISVSLEIFISVLA